MHSILLPAKPGGPCLIDFSEVFGKVPYILWEVLGTDRCDLSLIVFYFISSVLMSYRNTGRLYGPLLQNIR